MIETSLELMARRHGNKVLYDAKGNPSVFVPFYQMQSSFLDASLPGHAHPAFTTGGTLYDRILLGQYMASELENNGTLYSLPGRAPRVNLGMDPFLTRMQAFRYGVSGMTIADHGLILLMCHKFGWNPHGNNNYGHDYRDGTRWETGKSITVGLKRVQFGWEYTALKAHTSDLTNQPYNSPEYWEKGKQVGGVMVESQISESNYSGLNTITGSGPRSWCLGNDLGSLNDVVGNASEQVYGVRLVNLEIQIIPDNDAAAPGADLSATSTLWKAILPNSTDDGYTLVEPGTPGTVHYAWLNNKVTLVARALADEEFTGEYKNTQLKDVAVDSTTLPYVPYILKELGLAPITGMTVPGVIYIQLTKDERVARRGGHYLNPSNAGPASLDFGNHRSYAYAPYGGRPRSLWVPDTW